MRMVGQASVPAQTRQARRPAPPDFLKANRNIYSSKMEQQKSRFAHYRFARYLVLLSDIRRKVVAKP